MCAPGSLQGFPGPSCRAAWQLRFEEEPYETGGIMYKIIRFYRNGKTKLIKKVSTLEIAQLHCRDPKTRKVDKNNNVIWFDGYDEVGRGGKNADKENARGDAA